MGNQLCLLKPVFFLHLSMSTVQVWNTQPPLFSTGVVDGSTLIWAAAICAEPTIRTSEPASAAGSLREVFIGRILATPGAGGNREG